MAQQHGNIGAVAVCGGLVVVGGSSSELYDEESGRWVTPPHVTIQLGSGTGLVSVPAAALLASDPAQEIK
jgi:hypothetical protein